MRSPSAPSPRPLPPLLRWAGGKRWLADGLRAVGQFTQPSMYVEPFLGGAAVFLGTEWPNPVIGDVNSELMRCYAGLAKDPTAVRSRLSALDIDRATFERIRRWKPTTPIGAATRLLYLNRTSFSGIYRVNAKGEFNVPFAGDRDLGPILKGSRLEDTAAALAQATLIRGDFDSVLSRVRTGALIYCDPPYSLEGSEKQFRRYSRSPFQWDSQRRLARRLQTLVEEGNTVLLSNSAHESVGNLYPAAAMLPLVRRSALAREGTPQKEGLYFLHRSSAVAEELLTIVAERVR